MKKYTRSINPWNGEIIFSKAEIIDCANTISTHVEESAEDVYYWLIYRLGPHYWGYDYRYTEVAQ